MENIMGQAVNGAGNFYTEKLTLQQRKHFSKESFEVTPMEPGIDTFLPFWWIA